MQNSDKLFEEELLFSCVCHGYHFVEFIYDKDFGLTITHVERPRRWQDKLKAIWNVIREETVFDGECIIKNSDLDNLIKALQTVKKSQAKTA